MTAIVLVVLGIIAAVLAAKLLGKVLKLALAAALIGLIVIAVVFHPHLSSINNFLPGSVRPAAKTAEKTISTMGSCFEAIAKDVRKTGGHINALPKCATVNAQSAGRSVGHVVSAGAANVGHSRSAR